MQGLKIIYNIPHNILTISKKKWIGGKIIFYERLKFEILIFSTLDIHPYSTSFLDILDFHQM